MSDLTERAERLAAQFDAPTGDPFPSEVAATLRALVEERKRLTDGIGKALSSMQTVQDVMDGKVCAKSYRREWDAVMFLRAALTPPPGGEVG